MMADVDADKLLERMKSGSAPLVIDVRSRAEFDAGHVRKFYAEMHTRFEASMKSRGMEAELQPKLADGLSPLSAVMLATRVFFNYFSIEVLFGVKDHFGKGTDDAIHEIARILRHGMLKDGHPQPK